MSNADTPDWNMRYAQQETPWDSGQPSGELIRLLEQFRLSPAAGHRRCLEIGCGTGTNAIYLAQQGFHVTAVDIAPLAVEQASRAASEAGVEVEFGVQDLSTADAAAQLCGEQGPFDMVFDRGVYHCVRRQHLDELLRTLAAAIKPGGTYIHLAGNSNDTTDPDMGPPRVTAEEILAELGPLFELRQLREFYWEGVVVEGEPLKPLGWSIVWRRK